MIRLLADQHIYKLNEIIPPDVSLTLYDPIQGLPEALGTFDALFTRTVTQINETTLPTIPESLKFVGTASSGDDHFDLNYLSDHGIHTANAKGCNANTVAEYVITALLIWARERENFGKIGIVGGGFTGTAVASLLKRLDIDYTIYDPPRQIRDSSFTSAPLDDLLECDILTFHVPLIYDGLYPTHHWLNSTKLKNHSFKLIINAARGGIINEEALLEAKKEERVQDFILDVWENEPDLNTRVANEAYLATPHIAGYSEQAKLNATFVLVEKLLQYFSLKSLPAEFAPNTIPYSELNDTSLSLLLEEIHPIRSYDKQLRSILSEDLSKATFAALRTNVAYRYEYPNIRISSKLLDRHPTLSTLGIRSL